MQIDVANDQMYTDTYYFTIINIDNQNNILFSYFNQKIYLSTINIKTNDFSDSSFEKLHKSNEEIEELEELEKLSILKCFMTEKKFIECIYVDDDQYLVAVYDESLNYLNNIFLQTVDYTNPTHTSINAICLKNEIGIFFYYIKNSEDFSPLRIQINELYYHEGRYQFNNLIPERNVSFGDINYLKISDENLEREDLTKITDNIFSYVILYSDSEDIFDYVILIIIFDLFNNDKNLFIRYYTINSALYNIRIHSKIKLFNFNSFLGLSFYGGKESGSFNNAFYVILGNSKKNIDKMSLDIYKLNQGFILDLKDHYSSIDNNLFGYKLNIKISYISNGLEGVKFFSINKNKEIKMNELINEEDSIIFDFSDVNVQIGKEYVVNITSTVLGPEYNKFIELCDKYEKYGEDYSNYYESRIVEEKIFTIEIKFSCHESSTSCDYPNLTTKTIQNDDNNIIYLSNFVYKGEEKNLLNTYLDINNYDSNKYCKNNVINTNKYIFENNCINECPSKYTNDSSNKCIFMCTNENQYIFNSNCYDECPEGTISGLSDNNLNICKCQGLYYTDENNDKICLSSSKCDNDHPILDESTNECLNYRVQYGNEYLYECPKNTCISERFTTKKICEDKTPDMKIYNGICFNDFSLLLTNFKNTGKKNIRTNDREGITLSLYSGEDYSKNFDELLKDNINTTMIDIRECLSLYRETNNIDEKTDIYMVVVDTPRIYSNETVNRFDFELYFDNLTKINNLDVCKDTKMKVYSPIKNTELLNLELGSYFSEQGGYNIFNKNDKFYTDVCSGANMEDNDMTLDDRYVDVYPHDVQICPNNCECSGINYTINVFMCDCDVKIHDDENDSNDYGYNLTNSEEILNYFKDFNNLLEYFSDMFNYKIIKCFDLLYNLDNYKYNTGFYLGISFYVLSLSLLLFFRIIGFQSIRMIFINNLKDIIKEKNTIVKKKNNEITESKDENEDETTKKKSKSNHKHKNKHNLKNHHHNKKDNNYINENINNPNKRKTKDDNTNIKTYNTDSFLTNDDNDGYKNKINKTGKNINNIDKEIIIDNDDNNDKNYMNSKEINELPYFKANIIDDRNFFKILLSVFLLKIDLLQNIFIPEEYSSRFLLFSIYLLSLYIDLLMNCLLYNDYAISQKYHCNGNLEFVTSLIMSLLSNILSFILFYFIKYLTNFSDIIGVIIKEFKNIKQYLYIIIKLFRVMNVKFHILLILEIILGFFMVYYLFVFSTINAKSINSFLLNYLYSQLESLIYSFAISLLISIIRSISLCCHSKRMYIISTYFNEHL